jgi:hypothetical protein
MGQTELYPSSWAVSTNHVSILNVVMYKEEIVQQLTSRAET